MAKLNTIATVNVIEGEIDVDLDQLSKILLDNYSNRISSDPSSTFYEDSTCPPNPIVDHIIDQMIKDFYDITGERIVINDYWGHIHEKGMSTNTHNHDLAYASGVFYVAVPKGSGSICFRPNLNRSNINAYLTSFPPKEGKYYIFPGYLDHYVTRNGSDQKRIAVSFNFVKDNLKS